MKLFGLEISRGSKANVEALPTQAVSATSSQGMFYRGAVDIYKPKDLQSYYDAYMDKDIVRAPLDDLVESAVGQGSYISVKDESNIKYQELCEEFWKYFVMDDLLVNIAKNMLIAGFQPVETRLDPNGIVKNCALKIIFPLTVSRIETTKAEPIQIVKLVQNTGGSTIDGKYVAQFTYGRIGNDPLGLSYVRGVINALNLFDNATMNVDALLNRYTSPVAIWKTMGDTEPIKRMVMSRKSGEDFYMGHLSQEEINSKDAIVQFISIDPRVPFWDYIELLDRRIYSYFRSNNLYYSKDATVASAEVMDAIVQRHQRVIRRTVKDNVERCWFEPLVRSVYPDAEEIPTLNFPIEKTGMQRIEIGSVINSGMQYMDAEGPYLTREQYYDLLAQFGFSVKTFKPDPKNMPPAPNPSNQPAVRSGAAKQG